jgi:ferritin-like metal-binding protein YciE
MLFERFNKPEELYNFKLGQALSMEQKNLKMLDANAEEANDPQLAQLMRHHQDETRQQIDRIEQSFRAFGWEPDESMCLTMEALDKEAKLTVKRTDDRLKDFVVASGAAETEHHEIGVYESLIAGARAMGRNDVVQLLQQNLEQEQHTLQEVKNMEDRVLASMPSDRAV